LKDTNLDDGAWTFVWEALEETTRLDWEERNELISLGRKWLLENTDGASHGAWPGVLTRLIYCLPADDERRFPADAELREAAWTWLERAGLDHGSGSFVWGVLIETTDDNWQHRDALVASGQQWFASHRIDYDAAAWPSIVSQLVRRLPADAELREAAWTWLERAGLDHGVGPPVWGVLIETTDDNWQHREALVALGRQWFAAHRIDSDAAAWPSIVLRLVRRLPADSELR
jgi:hypothetical protein